MRLRNGVVVAPQRTVRGMTCRGRLLSILCVVLLGGVVSLVDAGSASAATWSVSLTASATEAEVGTTVTLTATANQSVTGTGLFIDIMNQTTGEGWSCYMGSSCNGLFSNAQPGTHTYIAYVDGDPEFNNPPCCIQATSNTVNVTWHAKAVAAFDIGFVVSGTLPTFPCPNGCDATFGGTGSGTGTAQARQDYAAYDASFTIPSGVVTGTANYTEPLTPFCPGIGDAVGTVSFTGDAVGVLTRTLPAAVGEITAVGFTLEYTYSRAGPVDLIVITGGTATIFFDMPDTGTSYFTSSVTGAGPGSFVVSPIDASTRCQKAAPLPFTAVGDVALMPAQ